MPSAICKQAYFCRMWENVVERSRRGFADGPGGKSDGSADGKILIV
jgi:hypothetical protein